MHLARGEVRGVAEKGRPLGNRVVIVCAAYLLIAVIATWPLALHISNRTSTTFEDVKVGTWVLAWDAHTLAHHPTALFQAPIFSPSPDSLAFTDHMLGIAIFAAPVEWLTGNPYTAHNLVLILSLAFAGLTAFLLAREITGDLSAAFVGGAAYMAAPYWYGPAINMSHVEMLATGWIPLTLYGLTRWLRTGRPAPLCLATASFVMATLTSWYQGTFLCVAVIVTVGGFMLAKRPKQLWKMLAQGFAATLLIGVILIPFAIPYLRGQSREPTFTRTRQSVTAFSASPTSFLAAPYDNLLYGPATKRWRSQFGFELTLFPGSVVVVLTGLALLEMAKHRHSDSELWTFLALIFVGMILAFGTSAKGLKRFLPWRYLADHVIAFRALRAPARAEIIVILGLSMTAAIGAHVLLAKVPRRATIVAGLISGLILLEGLSIPQTLGHIPVTGPAYKVVAQRPGIVMDLPTGDWVGPTFIRPGTQDGTAMLNQTRGWWRLANGTSGFVPSAYRSLMAALRTFPDPQSVHELRMRGISTVVLRLNDLKGTLWQNAVARLAALHVPLIARDNYTAVYDLASS